MIFHLLILSLSFCKISLSFWMQGQLQGIFFIPFQYLSRVSLLCFLASVVQILIALLHASHSLDLSFNVWFFSLSFYLSEFVIIPFKPICHLNSLCLTMRSGEWIQFFALLSCIAFAFPVKLFYSQPTKSLTFTLLILSPHPTRKSMQMATWGLLNFWLRFNHDTHFVPDCPMCNSMPPLPG